VRKKAGPCLLEWRKLVCGVMIVLVPTSLLAQGTGRALLYSQGGVWLNGTPAPESSAIFPESHIQTQKNSTARIDAEGSTVTVQPDTIVQFEGDELVLDHGGLQLSTAREMRVRVNCLTVIPVTAGRTQYEVTDVDGKVIVVAYKNDVKIHSKVPLTQTSKQKATLDVFVHEGEQVTRDERCGASPRPVEANGAILNSPWAIAAGAVAVGVLTCWALCRGDNPISPVIP